MSYDNPIQSEFYGDNVRWFIATVIDASPPFGFEGRVKIRVHGLHSPETYLLPQQDLPWANVFFLLQKVECLVLVKYLNYNQTH